MIHNKDRVSLQLLRTLNNVIHLHYSPCFGYFDETKLRVGHLIEIPLDELPPQTIVILLHTLKVMSKLKFEYGSFSDTWLVVERMNSPIKIQLEIDSENVIEFNVEYLPKLTNFSNSQAPCYVEYNFEYTKPNLHDKDLAHMFGDMNEYIIDNMDLFELKPKSLCDWYYRLVRANPQNERTLRTPSSSLYIMQQYQP
jgi:hypothetical protein